MDKKDLLKSVLQNFINDKPDEAKADFHQYLTLKSKEITGIGAQTPPVSQITPEPAATVDDPAAEPATPAATDVTPEPAAIEPAVEEISVAQ